MRILSLVFVATLAIGFSAGCGSVSGSSDGGGTGGNGSGGTAGGSGGVVGTGGNTGGSSGASGGSGGKGGSGGAAGTGGASGGSGGKGGSGGAAGTGGASGGSGGKGGGGGAAGAGGASGAGGGMTCSPACGSGSICVGTGTQGGAFIMPNDAGVCPSGRHLVGNNCVSDLAYACMTIPTGCAGTVTCACASSLCPTQHACGEPSGGILSCIESVP